MDTRTDHGALRLPHASAYERARGAALAAGHVDLLHVDAHAIVAEVRDPTVAGDDGAPVTVDLLLDGAGASLCSACREPACAHVAAVLDTVGLAVA